MTADPAQQIGAHRGQEFVALQPGARLQPVAGTLQFGASWLTVIARPPGCALFVLVCLVTSSLRKTGLVFVMLVVGTALAVRVFGIILDGTFADSLRVLVAETVLLCLCFAAYSGERLAGGNSAIHRT